MTGFEPAISALTGPHVSRYTTSPFRFAFQICFFVSVCLCDYLLHFTNQKKKKKKPFYQWSYWARMHIGGRHLARQQEKFIFFPYSQ